MNMLALTENAGFIADLPVTEESLFKLRMIYHAVSYSIMLALSYYIELTYTFMPQWCVSKLKFCFL